MSLFFSLDVECTSQDIATGLSEAGVNAGAITSIQRRLSNESWVISFCLLEQALGVGCFPVGGFSVGRCE